MGMNDVKMLDGVDADGYVGKIIKGGQVIGRIDMGSDGKAMVFVGDAGDQRVKLGGRDAMYSDDDAALMVDALLTEPQVAQQAVPQRPADNLAASVRAASSGKLGLHVIQYPSGRFGYVGTVPDAIAYEPGATQEQISNGKQFGERFGPKKMTFSSEEEAIKYAKDRGFDVIGGGEQSAINYPAKAAELLQGLSKDEKELLTYGMGVMNDQIRTAVDSGYDLNKLTAEMAKLASQKPAEFPDAPDGWTRTVSVGGEFVKYDNGAGVTISYNTGKSHDRYSYAIKGAPDGAKTNGFAPWQGYAGTTPGYVTWERIFNEANAVEKQVAEKQEPAAKPQPAVNGEQPDAERNVTPEPVGLNQGPLPWDGAPSSEESRWFGTVVRLTAIDRKAAERGLVREGEATLYNVINGGKALSVKWPGQEATNRLTIRDQYIVEVVNLVDSKAQEERATKADVAEAGKGRPSAGRFVPPTSVASRDGQMLIANRSGRISGLAALNDSLKSLGGSGYSDDEIQNADNIDAMQEWLSAEIVKRNKQAEDPAKSEAKTFLQSVIDGTADMMDLGLADRLTAIHDQFSGDSEIMALFNDAAKSYSGWMIDAAKRAMS